MNKGLEELPKKMQSEHETYEMLYTDITTFL